MPNDKTYLVVSRGEYDNKGSIIENADHFEIVGNTLVVSNDRMPIAAFSEWVSIQEVEDELD